MIDKKIFQQKIDSISNIPTLPVVIEKLTRLLQNPQTSAEEVGRVITTDPAIASKVLKLVNSAFYGFPGKISTITHAIVILGFSTVKNIVLTASIFDFFKKRGDIHPDFDMQKFWVHSIACGAAAQSIAKYVGFREKEECFIGGLIHDIGKVILCQYFPDEFAEVVHRVKEKDVLFFDAERELLGVTHQEIGGTVATRWNLPKNLQGVVLHHHAPSPQHDGYTIAAIVHCSDILVRALDHGNGGDTTIPLVSESAWNSINLQNLALGPLLEDIENEIEKALILIQLV